MCRHTIGLGLQDDEVERQEQAEKEQKGCNAEKEEWELHEWVNEFHQNQGLRGRGDPRLHGHIGDYEHEKNQKSRNPHGPSKSHLFDQSLDHDWEDDATKTGTRGSNAKG